MAIMRLTSLRVTNYRSCTLTTLTPHAGLTALIGVNGSGKSNLLSAILLLKKAAAPSGRHSRRHAEYLDRSSIAAEIDYDGNPVRIRSTIFYATNNRNRDEVHGANFKFNLKSITSKDVWIDVPEEALMHYGEYRNIVMHGPRRSSSIDAARWRWFARRMGLGTKLSEGELTVIREVFNYLEDISYYSASQFSDPSRCPVSLELEDDRPRGRRWMDVIDHEQFIYDLYRSFKAGADAFESFKHVIGQASLGLVDDITFEEIHLPSNVIEVRSGGKAVSRERTQLIVVPILTVAGRRLSPNQLSEGTFRTMALLFYILTDGSGLLLVEEPEVCIHHGLLTSVIGLIKEESRGKQIVISTHSDHVLDQLDPDNVVLVDRVASKGTKARKITHRMSRSNFQALREYLENSGSLGEYWREGGLLNE